MKVAFISFDFGQYCIRLANALVQKTEILLLLPHELTSSHTFSLNCDINFQPFDKPRLRQPLQQFWTIHQIIQHIRHFNPDVIHFQHRHLWFNLMLPLLKQYPLVITIHDPRTHLGDKDGQKTPQAIADFGYRRADQIIVHGNQLKRRVVDLLKIPSDIVHVIPPVPDIVIADDTAQNRIQEDNLFVLFFGRIWEYKGLEYLIRAEPFITAEVPGTKIVIAGHGEDFGRYRRMMVHPEHFIVYNEYISDAKVAELFQRASLVVLPYIDGSISGVVPVAGTFAKPVVATAVGILPEMIDHGRTGYIVPPRDERALADAIVRILRDKDLRDQLGANGRQKVETVYSPDSIAQQTLDVYKCAIDYVNVRASRKHNKSRSGTPAQD